MWYDILTNTNVLTFKLYLLWFIKTSGILQKLKNVIFFFHNFEKIELFLAHVRITKGLTEMRSGLLICYDLNNRIRVRLNDKLPSIGRINCVYKVKTAFGLLVSKTKLLTHEKKSLSLWQTNALCFQFKLFSHSNHLFWNN